MFSRLNGKIVASTNIALVPDDDDAGAPIDDTLVTVLRSPASLTLELENWSIITKIELVCREYMQNPSSLKLLAYNAEKGGWIPYCVLFMTRQEVCKLAL